MSYWVELRWHWLIIAPLLLILLGAMIHSLYLKYWKYNYFYNKWMVEYYEYKNRVIK